MTTVEEHTGPASATTEVLRRARLGSREAWDELVRRYSPAIAAAVRSYRLQDSDARDATQRTWLRLLEHHGSLREPEALGHWLTTTARRECLRILREHRRVSPVEHVGQDRAAEASDIEQQVVDAELLVRVRTTMQGLPERSRILLEALFGEDPPRYADLAGAHGIPIGSIGPTRARALRQLRRQLESTLSPPVRWPGRVT